MIITENISPTIIIPNIYTTITIPNKYNKLPHNWKLYDWNFSSLPSVHFLLPGNILIYLEDAWLVSNSKALLDVDGEIFEKFKGNVNLPLLLQKIWSNEKNLPSALRNSVTSATARMLFWLQDPVSINLIRSLTSHPHEGTLHFNKSLGQPASFEVDDRGNFTFITNALLGRGSTKKVRVAVDSDLNLRVFYSVNLTDVKSNAAKDAMSALKKLLPISSMNRIWERFKKEVEMLNHLQGEGVLHKYHDSIFFTQANKARGGIVGEYCNLGDLTIMTDASHLRTHDNLSSIIFDLLTVLCHLEEKKVLHRDIKPENILLKYEGNEVSAILSDFDLSVHKYEEIRIGHPGSIEFMYPTKVNAVINLHAHLSNPSELNSDTDRDKTRSLVNIISSHDQDIWGMGMVFYALFSNNCTIWNGEFENCTYHEMIQKLALTSQEFIDSSIPSESDPNSIWLLITEMLSLENPPTALECLDLYEKLLENGMILT